MSDLPAPRHSLVSVVGAAVEQLRPKQWAKNGVLFAALVFSGEFLVVEQVGRALVGFAAFCLVSSAGYVLNDYLDREADRKHPRKSRRPLASGRLPVPVALSLLVAITLLGVGLSVWLSPLFFALTALYLTTTLSYSFYFKHRVILDVMFIATGFVWRALAGAAAIGVAVSPWFFVTMAFLALFLGFNKRAAELLAHGDSGTRRNLAEYSTNLLTQFQAVVTGNVVITYALYAILGGQPWMVVTVPFVLYIIFRYAYLVERHGEGGAPEDTLFSDWPLLLTVGLYGLSVMGIIVGSRFDLLPAGLFVLPH